jgi:HSP20 family protein
MPETSPAAVQTAPSRPTSSGSKTEGISERIERIYDAISRRAYQLFERDGRVHGLDTNHWLEAEKELFLPVQTSIEETDAEFVVRAEVPGFTATDLEVNVELRRVTISGKRETKQETKKGETLHREENSTEIFRALELPSEANPAKVSATLKDSVLEIKIPKAEIKKSVPVNSQAS